MDVKDYQAGRRIRSGSLYKFQQISGTAKRDEFYLIFMIAERPAYQFKVLRIVICV
jgi:hypothetical protein